MLARSPAATSTAAAVTTLQYWRSTDDLLGYAADPGRGHRPAWWAFYQRARRADGAVGIWHETYSVPAGAHEQIYANMPVFGLAAVIGAVPVGRRGDRAAERLAG